MQAPGGKDEDRDGGFAHGGWTRPYWHDDIGASFGALMQDTDAFLLGRRTYVTHAEAFEPMPAGDSFGDMMNTPAKYVVSKTLEEADLAQHDDHPRRRRRRGARAQGEPGKNILTDGSSQLVHALFEHDLVDELYLLRLSAGARQRQARVPGAGVDRRFALVKATPYPTGVVGLHYTRVA